MLKSTVNKYLEKYVEVKLFDNSEYIGILTSTTNIPCRKNNSYFCKGTNSNCEFKSSHIIKIKLLKD